MKKLLICLGVVSVGWVQSGCATNQCCCVRTTSCQGGCQQSHHAAVAGRPKPAPPLEPLREKEVLVNEQPPAQKIPDSEMDPPIPLIEPVVDPGISKMANEPIDLTMTSSRKSSRTPSKAVSYRLSDQTLELGEPVQTEMPQLRRLSLRKPGEE